MTRDLDELFASNRRWAEEIRRRDPEFFQKLSRQQRPRYLWIGCADSRVPANEIVGLMPGELFVHRNIANVLVHTDLNSLSVVQFAVEMLKVQHVIVCGHYGCSGVSAALRRERVGLADNWLRHVQDVCAKHEQILGGIADKALKVNRLCELNVIEQVSNLAQTTVIQDAWAREQDVTVHGWIYDIRDGLLRDLHVSATNEPEFDQSYRAALTTLPIW
ncbi:MAG TPA: carbonate dehydratase [Methylomirabilota bacterium]|nr:carbonate dehydratase [Methylomirabilota bacterium]